MADQGKVFGAGGGGGGGGGKGGARGGGGGSPKTDRDSLESLTKVRVLDLIGEGEIDGLVDPFGVKNATFTQTGTTIEIDLDNHGLSVGARVNLVLKGTTEVNNLTITKAFADSFEVESLVSQNDSGSCTVEIRFGRLQSVFLDDVAAMNANGLANYNDIRYRNTFGVSPQRIMKGYNEAVTGVDVNQVVRFDNPIESPNLPTGTRKIAVLINVPQLQRYEDDGDIKGSKIQLSIAYAESDGVFHRFKLRSKEEVDRELRLLGNDDSLDDNRKVSIIKGRTGDPYQRRYEIDFDDHFGEGNKTVQKIRVERRNADSTNPRIQNSFSFYRIEYITEPDDQDGIDLSYPNCALVGLQVSAEEFNSVPRRSYRVRGIKVKIPNGVTVDQDNGRIIYPSGYVFNGTLGAAQWTTDPAWCLYDLLTSERYGLGEHINAESLDIYAFQSASAYASTLVPKEVGSSEQEPRFSLNVNLQGQQDAYKVINDISSVFRGMPFYSTGSLTLTQDKPTDASYLFTSANVTREGFNYEGSSLKVRSTVVVVKYFDMDEREPQYEEVKVTDSDIVSAHPSLVDDIDRYGTVVRNLDAFGCTSRFQARRLAKWALLSERLETETVTFTASVDAGVVVRPGQVIKIADPVRAGIRRAGRIKAVGTGTPGTITVDDTSQTDIPEGQSFSLSVVNPDGSLSKYPNSSYQGSGVLQLPNGTALDPVPNVNSVWVIENDAVEAQLFRVIAVEEEDGILYKITALAHNPSKYNTVEQGENIITRSISTLNTVPESPSVISITQQLYKEGDQVLTRINVYWKPVDGVGKYEVRWRLDDDNFEVQQVKTGSTYVINNARRGTYVFKIFSLSPTDKRSTVPLSASFTAVGKQALPSTVKNFKVNADAEQGLELSWDAPRPVSTGTYTQPSGSTTITATMTGHGFAAGDEIYMNIATASGTSDGTAFSPPASKVYTIASVVNANSFTFTAEENENSQEIEGPIDTGFADLDVRAYEIQLSLAKTGTLASADFDNANWVESDDLASDQTIAGIARVQATDLRATVLKIATLPDSFKTAGASKGSLIYTIKAIDAEGNYSQFASKAGVTLTGPAAVIDLSSAYVGENVVLKWGPPEEASDARATIDGFDVLTTNRSRVSSYKITANATTRDPDGFTEFIETTEYVTKVLDRSRTYVVKAINLFGGEGTQSSITVTNSRPPKPDSLTARVVDNSVLLNWTKPTTDLPIVEYEIQSKRQGVGADFTSIAGGGTSADTISSLFYLHSEVKEGKYTYRVRAVDSTGVNDGVYKHIRNVVVNAPRDFTFVLDEESTLQGTINNGTSELDENGNTQVIFAYNATQTWASHFTSNSKTTIQGFINAGYTEYLTPSVTSGYYEETFDMLSAFSSGQVNVAFSDEQIVGTTTVTQQISHSTNNSSFTSVTGDNPFIDATFRYLKVRLNFTSTGDNNLTALEALRVSVSRRTITAEGVGEVTDAGNGKLVNLTGFTRINSVVITVKQESGSSAVYGLANYDQVVNQNDGPRFRAYLYNGSGSTVTGKFSYVVRGQA